MGENKIIAFDLGSNSIGATIRNPFEEEQFEKAIVVTFDTGVAKDSTSGQYTVSLAANRTNKRSVRRLYQSRKYKLWSLLEALIHDKNNLYCPIQPESLKRWKHYDKEQAQKGNSGRQYPVDDAAFNDWIKLDFNNDGIPDYISPYQLRNELATIKLDFSIEENRFKLGRALYHIAQHRGFKSSKIVKNKDDEKDNKNTELTADAAIENAIGAEKKKQERFYDEVTKLEFTINQEEDTIGTIYALIENEGIHNPDRKTEGIRIRKELHQFVTRKLLIKEVKKIFEFQELDFGSIFKDKKGNPVNYQNSTIFKQRPLRSQKGLVGICTLENKLWEFKDSKGNIHLKRVGKKRSPVSRPEFEEFRALGLINNIAVREKKNKNAQWDFLPLEQRDDLYKGKFFVQKDFTFEEIYKYKPLVQWLNQKYGKDNWELNYNYKTNVPACSVSTRLQKILGEKWNETTPKKDKNDKEITIKHVDKDGTIIRENPLTQPLFEDVWHVLFESNDEDFISEYAQEHNFNEKDLVNLWYAMPVGYAQLSLKAINNILPFLREGNIYTDAVLLAKVPEILGEHLWEENKKMITQSLKTEVIAKNREKKRLLNIVNNLIAQYKSLSKKDKFAENKDYIVGSRDNQLPEGSKERDSSQILAAIEDGYGKETWKSFPIEEKEKIRIEVTNYYQQFFNSTERVFYSLPRLDDAMKKFIRNTFESQFMEGEERNLFLERIEKLYHPSMLDIYPKAKAEYYKYEDIVKQTVLLGSPKVGAWKNPMALRTLHELKKLTNYLIATGEIDEESRVVVEVGRELVDTNKRWAYETYQKIREDENKEFASAILELVKREGINASPENDSDLDKFRLWYEMLDSTEGYDKSNKFISVDEDRTYGEVRKKTSKRGKKKADSENGEGEEERYYTFSENHFDKIKKEVWLKLKKAKDNVEERYRLWKEQQCFCIYTNKAIKISDLFNPNLIDVEHTIPRSISFDNSLANKTVCYADYNRNVKKNKIPADLGDDYVGIKQRIEKWEQKVKDLEVRVEFWKGKSKQASTKDYKDTCIRQKHLWQFELDYWHNKVERFKMTEVKAGFKNSQLKDTQLISKFAFHYLKSYFNKVDIQKGEVTAEFRKIFNIQKTDTPKDRSKHSHHAKDAIILSVIPVAAIRDKMLEVWYKIKEQKKLLQSNTEKDKLAIEEEIKQLEEELNQLKIQCFPKGLNKLNNIINKLDETLLINNIARNRSLLPASKKTKVNGEFKKATGDAVRGQLHKDSFFGAIKLVKKDKHGKWVKNEKGKFEFEPIKYVIREELVYKTNSQSPGFKDLNDLKKQIVDKDLYVMIEKQVNENYNSNFKEALKQGIWMLDKKGNRVNKIRRVRIELRDKEPVEVKSQTNINTNPSKILPDRKHKQKYYAANGENIAYAMYEDEKKNKGFEMLSLFEAARLKQTSLNNNLQGFFPKTKLIGKAKREGKIIGILKPGQKVIFYKEDIKELLELSAEDINKRLYKIISLYGKTTGQIQFQYHLEARPDKDLPVGVSKVNFVIPEPRYLLSPSSFDFAIEGKHFGIKPDGKIIWKL
jgi:CRISPR-associated endonuclease Csn1